MFGWDPRFVQRSPLFWPLREAAAGFETALEWPPVEALDSALSAAAGVHFRPQPPRPRRGRRRGPVDPAALYDARIQGEGWVPTRPSNWHDFLNALVWATFPASKRALHARQHQAMMARLGDAPDTLPDRRTREQDGLAILDEGSLLVLVDVARVDTFAAALEARDTVAAHEEITRGNAVALVFGHALYESLLPAERPSIWAMVVLLPCPGPLPSGALSCVQLADQRLAACIATPGSFSRPETFRSLPLDEGVLWEGSVVRREPR